MQLCAVFRGRYESRFRFRVGGTFLIHRKEHPMKFSGLHKQRLSVEKGGMRQNARRLAADEEKCEREDITLEKGKVFRTVLGFHKAALICAQRFWQGSPPLSRWRIS